MQAKVITGRNKRLGGAMDTSCYEASGGKSAWSQGEPCGMKAGCPWCVPGGILMECGGKGF